MSLLVSKLLLIRWLELISRLGSLAVEMFEFSDNYIRSPYLEKHTRATGQAGSPAIRHDILDFYARELVTFGGGRGCEEDDYYCTCQAKRRPPQ